MILHFTKYVAAIKVVLLLLVSVTCLCYYVVYSNYGRENVHHLLYQTKFSERSSRFVVLNLTTVSLKQRKKLILENSSRHDYANTSLTNGGDDRDFQFLNDSTTAVNSQTNMHELRSPNERVKSTEQTQQSSHLSSSSRHSHATMNPANEEGDHGAHQFLNNSANLTTVQNSQSNMRKLPPNEKSTTVESKYYAEKSVLLSSGKAALTNNGSRISTKKICNMTKFTSWSQGVVTQMKPAMERRCEKIAGNDKKEIYRVKSFLKNWKNEESDVQFVQRMNSCVNVIEEFSNNFYVSSEEKDFPLAFIFVVYTNVRQVVRLLKAIYRPHNLYCIHPDARQGEGFARVFRQISKCLDNVFVASKLEKVFYTHRSILDAQLNCMKDLTEYDQSRWKYVINLVGRELPLQTNRHIVKLLKQASDVSIVDSHPIRRIIYKQRFEHRYVVNYQTGRGYKAKKRRGAAPHGIKIYKGSTHFVLTRQFAHFLLTNQKAVDFRRYLNDVWMPEESFYASLYQLPEAASYGGHSNSVTLPISFPEVSIWLTRLGKRLTAERCSGLKVHLLCIAVTSDLHRVYEFGVKKGFLFFNKYFMEVDHVIMDCMEERLVKQNMLEYARDVECLLPSDVTGHH